MKNDSAAKNWVRPAKALPFEHSGVYMPAMTEVGSGGATSYSWQMDKVELTAGSGSRWKEALGDVPLVVRKIKGVAIDNSDAVFFVFGDDAEERRFSPPTVAEKLENIRDSFGLSASALAEVLRSSRASVYNWLADEMPANATQGRIDQLHSIGREWGDLNPHHFAPGRLMKQKLGDAPSLLECLSREHLKMDEVRASMKSLLGLMDKHRSRMDSAKQRASKAGQDTEVRREFIERLTGSVSDKS